MKPLIVVMVVALASALGGQVAAQPVERVAFTYCDDYLYGIAWCHAVVMDADGSNVEIAGQGWVVGWSPDASRLAFEWDEVFVLDVRDGTVVTGEGAPAWSPDGSNVAFVGPDGSDGRSDVFVTRGDGSGTPINLTAYGASYGRPAWSPDGTKLAFASDRARSDGGADLFLIDADGSGLRRLAEDVGLHDALVWSLDGRRIMFTCLAGASPICRIDADGTGLTHVPGPPSWGPAVWSPDGTKLALVTADGYEIAVMDADGTGVRVLTVGANADDPAWSSDSRRIVFSGSSCAGGPPYGGLWIVNADGSGRACFGGSPGAYPGPVWMAAWMPGTVERPSAAPAIIHTPIALADANTDIVVTATITDDVAVIAATLGYRLGSREPYTTVALRPDGTSYTGTIPATAVTTDGVEYYLEARDTDGHVTRTPMVAPVWAHGIAVVASRPTLSVSPTTGPPGTEFTVTVTNWAGRAWDWLAVAPSGAGDGTYGEWTYLSALDSAAEAASWRVTVTEPGTFEARFFLDDGFVRSATSPAFSVVE